MADPWRAAASSGSRAVWTAGLHILLCLLHFVCMEDTVRDEGAGLLCMQTRVIGEGWQGHFGDKVRIQNYLDKLDEMAPHTEVKCEQGTTARHCISAGGTDCSHPGWERTEAWLFLQKGTGIMAVTG